MNDSPTNHLPAVQHPSMRAHPVLAPFMAGLPPAILLSTMPCRTADEAGELIALLERPAIKLWSLGPCKLAFTDFFLSEQWEEPDGGGEPELVMRTTLLLSDGRTVGTPSAHFRHSLTRQVAAWAGPPLNRVPPYDPPMVVDVRHEPSAKGLGPWLHPVFQLARNGGRTEKGGDS